jgi:hypothetical protein
VRVLNEPVKPIQAKVQLVAHPVGEGISTPSCNLRRVSFDSATKLEGVVLGNERHGFVKLRDVMMFLRILFVFLSDNFSSGFLQAA